MLNTKNNLTELVSGNKSVAKVLIFVFTGLLGSCGGSAKNNEPEKVVVKTEITDINIQGDLRKNKATIAEVVCANCIKSEASFTWKIDNKIVSTSNVFTPNEEELGKKVKVIATVPSVDGITSKPMQAHFQRRLVKKAFSNSSMEVFLMSDGELVWRAPNVNSPRSWPAKAENNFVDFKSATSRFGNVLTIDESGNYQEYGDTFLLDFGVSTKFEDVKEQLGTVVDYWIDATGHHALNKNNEVISWNVKQNGQRGLFELTKTKVENVKHVVSSIVNSGYTDVATAVLFNNGDLIIDALVNNPISYKRFTRNNIKKIQGIQRLDEPHSAVEHLAIFDEQDNVEIWSPRWGGQFYNNVDKIVSKNGESNFLVIKKDGSYVHSDTPNNHVVLDNSIRAIDLVQTRPGVSWGVLIHDGTVVDLLSGSPLHADFLSPEFLLQDIAYSHSIKNSSSFALVKSTGQAYLSTRPNYTIIDKIKYMHTPANFFIVVDGRNRLDSYFENDGNRKIDPSGFSNGLGYVENVDRFFPLVDGALTLDAEDNPVMIHTRKTIFTDPFIEKLKPQTSKVFFGVSANE